MHHLVTSYLDMQDFANVTGETPTAGSANQRFALLVCQAASRLVDRYTRRFFAQEVANKVFKARRGGQVAFTLPDLAASPTILNADVDRDGTYERDLIDEALVFELTPERAPYYYLEFLENPSLTMGSRLQIGNLWGWPRSVISASALSADITATATSIAVTDVSAYLVGQTVVIEDEMCLVTGVSGSTLVVTRGINGSTAAIHVATKAVNILTYPTEVVMAAGVAAARLWKRAATSFADPVLVGTGGMTDVGALARLQLGLGFPKEFQTLLNTLRRTTIGG